MAQKRMSAQEGNGGRRHTPHPNPLFMPLAEESVHQRDSASVALHYLENGKLIFESYLHQDFVA